MATSVRVWGDRLTERRPHLLRSAVIILVTLALAYFLGRAPSISYVQIPILLMGLWIVFQKPGLGILATMLAALVVPFAVGTGTQTALHLGFVLIPVLLGLWFLQMLVRRSVHFEPSRTTLPALGFILVTTLALVYGNLTLIEFAQHAPMRSQVGGWGIMVFSAGAFLLVGNQIKDVRWLKAMVSIFLGLVSIYFLANTIPGASAVARIFPNGAVESMTWLWFVALAGGQFLFNTKLNGWLRILAGLGVLLVLGFAYSPAQFDWASGWLPCTVVLLVLIFVRWPRLGIVLGIMGLIIGLIGFETVREVALTEDNQYSLLTRTAALQVVSQIIRNNPLLGVGPANYYWYTPLYSLLGYYLRFNSHNQYVDLLAQVGVVGTAFYLWLAAAVGVTAWRLTRLFRGGFERAYAAAVLAGIVGMLAAGALGDWILPFVYNIGVRGFRSSEVGWLFLGGLVVLEYLSRKQQTEAAEAAPPQSVA